MYIEQCIVFDFQHVIREPFPRIPVIQTAVFHARPADVLYHFRYQRA